MPFSVSGVVSSDSVGGDLRSLVARVGVCLVERVSISPNFCRIIYQSSCNELLWRRCPGLLFRSEYLEYFRCPV